MRFIIIPLASLVVVGCSQVTLTTEECMQLRKKEIDFITAVGPSNADQLRNMADIVHSCPEHRSKQQYECIMAAQTASEYAGCKV